MATYKENQAYVKTNYGFTTKTCWIAHIKEVCGIDVKTASTRILPDRREKPSPLEKKKYIEQALRYFNMI